MTMAKDRRNPQFLIKINGQSLQDLDIHHLVEEVTIEDNDDKSDTLDFTILNQDLSYTDDTTFDAGNEVEIMMGYDFHMRDFGKFVIDEPTYSFTQNGACLIKVHCKTAAIKIARHEKRRKFEKMTDSQIATQIAGDWGLKPQVDSTDKVYPMVVQSGESDIKFLKKRAKKYGYEVTVKNGKLIFEKPKFDQVEDEDAAPAELVYSPDETGSLLSFDVTNVSFAKGRKHVSTRTDPKTGKDNKAETTKTDQIPKDFSIKYNPDQQGLEKVSQNLKVTSGPNKGQIGGK